MFASLQKALASIALLSLAANGLAAQPAASLIDGGRTASYETNISTGSAGEGCPSQQGGQGCGSCQSGRGCQGCGGYHQGRFATRCNLIPHVAYINPLNSYYYFRPYQWFHVRAQQAEVITYGADPRQPYANLMFAAIYPELEAAWLEEALHNASPFEDDMTQDEATEMEERAETPVVPDRDTSTHPQNSHEPRTQATPAPQFEKPANNTATLPATVPHVFRTRR